MREGSVVKVKEEALDIYNGIISSEDHTFVIEYIDSDIAYMRRIVGEKLADWRVLQAIPKTLDDTGEALGDFSIVRPNI